MVFIDDLNNADWVKQTWDVYFRDDAGNLRLVEYDDELLRTVRGMGMTLDEFQALPSNRGYLKVRKGETRPR